MSQTAIMLDGYIDPTVCAYVCQNKTNCTIHFIAIYVPATDMPLKCQIYPTYAHYLMY